MPMVGRRVATVMRARVPVASGAEAMAARRTPAVPSAPVVMGASAARRHGVAQPVGDASPSARTTAVIPDRLGATTAPGPAVRRSGPMRAPVTGGRQVPVARPAAAVAPGSAAMTRVRPVASARTSRVRRVASATKAAAGGVPHGTAAPTTGGRRAIGRSGARRRIRPMPRRSSATAAIGPATGRGVVATADAVMVARVAVAVVTVRGVTADVRRAVPAAEVARAVLGVPLRPARTAATAGLSGLSGR
jgi:hypothetical protein